jgi:crotonobetainyl-CoA:carnitine CoA-transferase CaiB-like acyl-CoA transferase
MTQPHGSFAAGIMSTERGTNVTDSGAPFYDAYECSDGKWVTLGAVETKFYAQALKILGLTELLTDQWKKDQWPQAKQKIAERIRTQSRDQWCAAFEGTESCFAPVLNLQEAPEHPHLKARSTYVDIDGVTQPAPAPRFSRSVPETPQAFRPWKAEEAKEILSPWLSPSEIEAFLNSTLMN